MPPAIIIKLAPDTSYEETVKPVRKTVDPKALGVNVQRLRKTKDNHILVELPKDNKSQSAADLLSSEIKLKLGHRVGQVARLETLLDIEILDIDAVADSDEVLSALRTAVPGAMDDLAAINKRDSIQITGLWGTISGNQIAKARLPRSTANKIDSIFVGWTKCRVRERRLPSK